MRARARSAVGTLALAALAVGAVLLAWRGDRQGEAARAAKEREERVFGFDAKDVREVTVSAKGEVTRLVRGEADRWRIAAPVSADADAYAANGVVETLATLRRTREAAAPGGDLAPFGLASPMVKVEVVLDGGRRETLAVGDQSAFDGTLFVQPTSGAVWVVPAETRFRLERSTADLKAKPLPEQPTGGDAGGSAAAAGKRADPGPGPSPDPKPVDQKPIGP